MNTRSLTAALAAAVAAVVMIAAAPTAPAQDEGKSLRQVFNEAKLAFHQQDYDTAKAKFLTVLSSQPNHRTSQAYLAQIQYLERTRGGNPELERKMESIVISEVNLEDVTVEEAIEYITLKAATETEDKFKPNIVLKDLTTEEKQKTFQLKLSNVPLSYVLKTIGELSGLRWEYQKYAIVGAPPSTPTSVGAPDSPAGNDGGIDFSAAPKKSAAE